MTAETITWVRVGKGNASHLLAANGQTTRCGKSGQFTILPRGYMTCDRCVSRRA